MIVDQLRSILLDKSLLDHSFYKLWEAGKLNKSAMEDYAKQYYCFINNLPRLIALVYSKCENIISRRILLENLILEGNGRDNKAKTWCNFAIKLDIAEYDIAHATVSKTTESTLNKYWELCNQSYASGLGALYAFDFYIQRLTLMQMTALKKHYNIKGKEALYFFNSYQNVDMWNSDKISTLIVKLLEKDQAIAHNAAIEAHKAIWAFLDGVIIANNLNGN